MSTEPLVVEALRVHRMPGFPEGGLRLEELSPRVNVVRGSNASGKSTLAHALVAALWPSAHAPARAAVEARLRLDGDPWRVRVDAGSVRYLRDGEPVARPDLPPSEARDRYHLTLADLLHPAGLDDGAGSPFAKAVLRESAGGFDVGAARDELGYRETPPRSYKGRNAVEEAEKAYREAVEATEALQADEERLTALRTDLEEAEEAAGRAAAIRLAIEWKEREAALRGRREELAGFPEVLAEVRGNEAARARELAGRIAGHEEALDDLDRRIEEAEADLREADLPDGPPPDDLLATLQDRCGDLRRAEDRVDQAARELREAEAEREDAAAALGPDFPREGEPLAREELSRLDNHLRRVGELRAREEGLAELEGWVGEVVETPDPADLQRGLDELGAWLRARPPEGSAWTRAAPWLIAAGGAFLAVPAGAAAVSLDLWWALPGVVGLLLAAWGWALLPSDERGEERALRREGFGELGLPPPSDWTAEAVGARARELAREVVEARAEDRRAERSRELETRRETVDALRDEVEATREALATELGLDPTGGPLSLHRVGRDLQAWREAARAVARREEAHAAARGELDDLLAGIADDLAPYGYGPPFDPAEARGRADDLARRASDHEQATRELEETRTTREKTEDALEKARARERDLYASLGLEVGATGELEALCERREAWEEARRRADLAAERAADAREAMEAHPAFEEELRHRTDDELAEARARAEETAARRDDLRDEITTIETRVTEAKGQHEVEGKLAALEEARADLRARRTAEARRCVGWVVSEHVRRQTRERDRPAVFERARRAFARITGERYELELAGGDPPTFVALDRTEDRLLSLGELSDGTRLQLLLAVRVAFIEHQEGGRRLPLVLDETLANSDDERARTIIEALVEVARDGRQVIYLTAQGDEVGKWDEVLTGDDETLPRRFFDLDEELAAAEAEALDLPSLDVPRLRIEEAPPPDDLSHAAYGEKLSVPPFDPRGPISKIHLWYLVEDPDLLHEILDRGFERYGSLRPYLEAGDLGVLDHDRQAARRIRASARVLEELARALQVGRGRPVDRAVLKDSGAVTETFIDRVTELTHDLEGDAEALLDALEEGQVKRFRDSKRQQLETHLREEGHLDPRDPLTESEIRERIVGAVQPHFDEGTLDREAINRLVARALGTDDLPGG